MNKDFSASTFCSVAMDMALNDYGVAQKRVLNLTEHSAPEEFFLACADLVHCAEVISSFNDLYDKASKKITAGGTK